MILTEQQTIDICQAARSNPMPLNVYGCVPGVKCQCPRSFRDCSAWTVLQGISASLIRVML